MKKRNKELFGFNFELLKVNCIWCGSLIRSDRITCPKCGKEKKVI